LIDLLCELAPAAFCNPPRPLAIGIGDEIRALVGDDFKGYVVGSVLWRWCGRRAYLQALVDGGVRIALDGTERGQVTPEEQEAAANALAELQAALATDDVAFVAYCEKRRKQRAKRQAKAAALERQETQR
jgi:sRNA-binding protein